MRFTLALLVTFFVFLTLSNGAPSHHHKCSEKLYSALKKLCSYRGESHFLRKSAEKCCEHNCELSDMMTTCMVAPSFDDDLLK
ncbi:hypothetical protein B9Z55_006345 [Caenorhabditis nigoni]|uniref:Insulin-like domain-containing protein n=1 Tax=Caenorhabditis nigoni TaxID=1611254 RepID=A0A2G5V4N4_9PELO|nr:hypothetical protein B9Z55_006345 [Caenorhabditis nigoni]